MSDITLLGKVENRITDKQLEISCKTCQMFVVVFLGKGGVQDSLSLRMNAHQGGACEFGGGGGGGGGGVCV